MSAQLLEYSILVLLRSRSEKTITYSPNGLSIGQIGDEIQSYRQPGQLIFHLGPGGQLSKIEWKTQLSAQLSERDST